MSCDYHVMILLFPDSIYTERYMIKPFDNMEGYQVSTLISQLRLNIRVVCTGNLCFGKCAFYIAVYGTYKPIYAIRNVQTHLKSTV